MTNFNSDQIQDKIQSFLNGLMNENEKANFEKELNNNEALKAEVEFWKDVYVRGKKETVLQYVNEGLDFAFPPKKVMSISNFIKIAASVLIITGIAISIYLIKKPTISQFLSKEQMEVLNTDQKLNTPLVEKFEKAIPFINQGNPNGFYILKNYRINQKLTDSLSLFVPKLFGSSGISVVDTSVNLSQNEIEYHKYLLAVYFFNSDNFTIAYQVSKNINEPALNEKITFLRIKCLYELGEYGELKALKKEIGESEFDRIVKTQ